MIKSIWRFKWLFIVPFFLLFSLILHAPSVNAQTATLVAGAQPDECWSGCGGTYQAYQEGQCTGTPKRNQAYLWGLAKWGNDIWIGTGANIAVIGQTAGDFLSGGQQECKFEGPKDNPSNVIEGALSTYPGVPMLLRGQLGDWRPPQAWVYNLDTKQQTNVTPNDPLINKTLGLRAAGAANGIVILAGPRRVGLGLNMFAFAYNADGTYQYLGSKSYTQYSSIRKFVLAKGKLYTGIQTTEGKGVVLRWTGTRSNPFSFALVGRLDNDPANLVEHDGRLFAATWSPSDQSSLAGTIFPVTTASIAGIWMSPPIPTNGLNALHARQWTKVWQVTDYEPDPVIATTQGVGDLASFDGYLYWGTMNPSWPAGDAIMQAYGMDTTDEALKDEVREKAARAIAIFRGFKADDPQPKLLYGEKQLQVYDGTNWVPTNNNMGGVEPLNGDHSSGFGVPTNVYTWTMAVFQNRLCVGTLDSRVGNINPANPGGDLWYFNSGDSKANAFTKNGFGNPLTVAGIRTMISDEVDGLFVGTSSKANIHPEGGWKLFQIK